MKFNFLKKERDPNVLTLKESREIIKSNLREMKRLEKIKREKKTIDDYTTVMKSSDNGVCHVRPKALNSHDLAETPQGGMTKKMCYWLNRDYVLAIVKGLR